ncbi:6814_t:CDS:2, partial [Paraglomus occultum]
TLVEQQFFCQTCPYVFPITRPYKNVTTFKSKEVDDVLGGEEAWKNVDSTDAGALASQQAINYEGEHQNFGDSARVKEHVQQHLKDIPHPEKMSADDELYYLFSIHDVNKDGHLDGHELREAFIDHSEDGKQTLTLDEIIEMVDHVLNEDDMDNDGMISWEEYLLSRKYHSE